eukprot:1392964-Amorphochlora_amoeboformis.AAC.1
MAGIRLGFPVIPEGVYSPQGVVQLNFHHAETTCRRHTFGPVGAQKYMLHHYVGHSDDWIGPRRHRCNRMWMGWVFHGPVERFIVTHQW